MHNTRFKIVTTYDDGSTVIASANIKERAEAILVSAREVVGKPDWQGRVRVSAELIDNGAR
jgi:hypothetical protein